MAGIPNKAVFAAASGGGLTLPPGLPAAGDRRRRIAALRMLQAGIGVLLVAVALVATFTLVLSQRRATLEQVRTDAGNLALVLAEQTDRSLRGADMLLLDLQQRTAEAADGAAASVRATVAGRPFASWMQNRAASLPQLESLVVADTEGRLLASAGSLPAPWQEAAGAQLARQVAAIPPDAPHVATALAGGTLLPAMGRAWTVQLARRLTAADGSVAGVMAATLRIDALDTVQAALRQPGNGMVALLRRDGTLLLREPPAATGGQIPAGDAWRDVVAKGGGGTHALGLFDSTERVLAVRPLRDYPLVTVVGVDEYAALAAWRHDAGLIADAAVTAAGCILLLLGALLRQFRRVEASQAAMEAAHADLSRKSRELETTLAFMDQGLMMVDADGTVPVCNRRAIELLDLPPELMASRPTFEQVLAYQQSISEFRDNGPEVHAFVRAGGILDRPQTYERRRPCGRVIEVRSVPLAGRGVVRTYTDTTTRAMGEERFRQIVNDSPLAIALISTADHRFVQVNPACCALVGRPAACLVGQPWQDIIHPDDHDELAVRRTPAEGRVTLEARLVAGNGTVVWTRLTRSLLPAAPGRAPLVLAIGEDITPQREMKARLRQAQRLEAVGQLTGGVAHDFNNLLGIIMLDAESLAEVSAGDPERARLANDILATAANGAELTRRLLAFARKQTLQSQAMDLNACVADSAALLRRTLGEAIQVRLDLAPDLWPLRADPSQVGDALLNLALNARDAMPAGGTLTIGTANTRVDAGDASPDLPAGDYVALGVSDSGTGMTPDVLERVMEPFFTTKPPGAGSGLGLSMIYGFARQSGGALMVDSTPGAGTTVRLLLPRAAEAAQAAPPASPRTESLPGGVETVLVVDDNAAVRRVVVRHLRALGYAVLEAANGQAALLFTDLVMPGGVTGIALAEAGRQQCPGLKVLFTTGFAPVGEDATGPEPAPLLRKPYRREVLAEQVRAALDG